MKKILILVIMLMASNICFAEEVLLQSEQNIENEKSQAQINLNSQINPNGNAKEQNIKNIGSWFNININRYTFKFYNCPEDTSKR